MFPLVLPLLLASAPTIPIVELKGLVHPISAEYVVNSIDRADAEGAPLLILRIDTPGGLSTSMRQIVDKILNCRTPVVGFVGPSGARAASAGFIILMATDVAAMAPGTNTGAAHPVSALGGMDDEMAKKVTSDAAAYLRGKVERRGRNAELAEKAVVESRSFTDSEALQAHLVEYVVGDVPSLLSALDGKEIPRFDGSKKRLELGSRTTVVWKMGLREEILSLIANPEALFLLLLGALAGIGTEITHPGLLFPGVLGGLCLVLFLFASQVIPVNGAGVLLVALAILLLAAEVKIGGSHGLLTASGITAMILGAMMLVDAPIPEMRMRLVTLVPASTLVAAWTLGVLRLAFRARLARPTTGSEGLVGKTGVALSRLEPEGWVIVQGERWKATAARVLEAGERVRVVAVAGLLLRVEREA